MNILFKIIDITHGSRQSKAIASFTRTYHQLHRLHKNALPCGVCKAAQSLLFSLFVLALRNVREIHKRAAGSFVVAKFRFSALRMQQSVCPFVFTSNSAYLAAYHLISSWRQPSFTILAISSASEV